MDTVVYRGGFWDKICRAHLTRHRIPQRCFSLPSLQARPTRLNIEGLWPCTPPSPFLGLSDVYGYSSIQRGDFGTKYVRALLLTPHRTPSSVFHSPLCKLGPSHPSPNPQRCFSLPSLQARPTRPSKLSQLVYRRGILGQNMLGPSHPSPNPPAVFFTPLSCYRGGKKEPGVHAETVPPPHRKYFVPSRVQAKRQSMDTVVYRGVILGQNMLPLTEPPPPPPALFFTPLSAS